LKWAKLNLFDLRTAIALDSPRTGNGVYFKYFESSNVGDAEAGEPEFYS
jgi:hypothetical protein